MNVKLRKLNDMGCMCDTTAGMHVATIVASAILLR
jgi:hypothetical protein